jgi:eukaryotic-like serine/threonine-protein kinase
MQMMVLPPGETTERNLSWFDWAGVGDISPDGKTVIFGESGEGAGAKYGVFLRRTDGSPAVRLGDGDYAALSPDGKWLAALDLSSPKQIQLLPTGVGQPRRLTNDALAHRAVAWIPDGSGLVCIAGEPDQPARSYRLDLDGKSRAITPPGTVGVLVTPDSKYLLTIDGERKRRLYPLAGGDSIPFSANLNSDDFVIRFEPDGKSILAWHRGIIPAKIDRVFLNSNRRETVRLISPSDPAGVLAIAAVHFSADGKSYAYSYYRTLSNLWVVDGLR